MSKFKPLGQECSPSHVTGRAIAAVAIKGYTLSIVILGFLVLYGIDL